MRTLNVSLAERSYPIHIGPRLLDAVDLLLSALKAPHAAIVSNVTVAPLYLGRFSAALAKQGIKVTEIVLPDGEACKNWQTLNQIFDQLLEHHCDRSTTIIALGGGVVGDLAGFAAATYQRGIPFIQMPTTLLSQVDSSVGGKTGINHPLGKNMIGAFYQPRLVMADIDTLKTLADRELSAGIAEVIKYGLIADLPFLEWLEVHLDELLSRDPEALIHAIERSCRNKAAIVAADEREANVRALLNFGHTFGHGIEAGLGYGNWLHGEAVAAGMVMASSLSRRLGFISEADVMRVVELLGRARLPVRGPALGTDRYLDWMAMDKKVSGGKLNLVLLEALGKAGVHSEAPASEIRAAIEACVHD